MVQKELRIRGIEESDLQHLELIASKAGFSSASLFMKDVLQKIIISEGFDDETESKILQEINDLKREFLQGSLENKLVLEKLVSTLETVLEDSYG